MPQEPLYVYVRCEGMNRRSAGAIQGPSLTLNSHYSVRAFHCQIISLPSGELFQLAEHVGSLASPPAGCCHLRGVPTVLIVAVLASSRGPTAVSTTVHSTPAPSGDGRRLTWRPDLVRAPHWLAWDTGSVSVGRMGLSDNPLFGNRAAA